MQLYISSAMSPYGNPFGRVAVVASSREEAIKKAREALEAAPQTYVPAEEYRLNLLANLEECMGLDESGVFIDWSPAEKRGR